MVKIAVLVASYLLFTTNFLWAQCNSPSPPSLYFDEEVPLFCEGIHGYCSTLSDMYMAQPFPGCDEEFYELENPHVLSFIAGDEFIFIRITPGNCSMPFSEILMQGAIYQSEHPIQGGVPIIASCFDPSSGAVDLVYFDFIIGKRYYLLLDGWDGNVCDYEITVLEGNTIAPSITEIPVVSAPDEVCLGQDVTMNVESNVTCVFEWLIYGGTVTNTYEGNVNVHITDPDNFSYCATAISLCGSLLENCGFIPGVEIIQSDSIRVDSICNGDQIFFGGEWISSAGEYDAIDTINCEAYHIFLSLNILESMELNIEHSLCEGACYDHNGEELCEPGTYQFIYPLMNGCDSLVVIEILVIDPIEEEVQDEFCGMYEWNGEFYDSPGQYQQTLTSTFGCDSTVTLYLSEQVIEVNLHVTKCSNEIFFIDSFAFSDPIDIDIVFTSAQGCDSIVHLNLEEEQVYSESMVSSLCDGDTLILFGKPYYEEGNYQIVNETTQACDSVVFLQLNILDTSMITVDAAFTSGEEYNGIPIFADTTIITLFEASNGCDSTIIINISIVTNTKNENLFSSILVYPNPFGSEIHVDLNIHQGNIVNIGIYDIHGSQWNNKIINNNENLINLNVSELPTGTYILIVRTSEDVFHRKIIKY